MSTCSIPAERPGFQADQAFYSVLLRGTGTSSVHCHSCSPGSASEQWWGAETFTCRLPPPGQDFPSGPCWGLTPMTGRVWGRAMRNISIRWREAPGPSATEIQLWKRFFSLGKSLPLGMVCLPPWRCLGAQSSQHLPQNPYFVSQGVIPSTPTSFS